MRLRTNLTGKMRHLTFVIMLMISALAMNGQNSFIIHNDDNVRIDLAQYEKTLNEADLNQFRKINERTKLLFSNGIIVELYSLNELIEKGIPLENERMRDESLSNEIAFFDISPEGILLYQRPAQSPK